MTAWDKDGNVLQADDPVVVEAARVIFLHHYFGDEEAWEVAALDGNTDRKDAFDLARRLDEDGLLNRRNGSTS